MPTVSIMSTVLKALADNFSMGHKKLPAAPLTNTSIVPNFSTTVLTVLYTLLSSLTSHELPNTFSFLVSVFKELIALLILSIFLLMI